jgi:protein-S-isoprenylcysteine O-methyltransferase Ste14
MLTIAFGVLFGVIGVVLGNTVSTGSGTTNQPLWMMGFGVLFAILGAILGGSMDVVNVIKDRTSVPKK